MYHVTKNMVVPRMIKKVFLPNQGNYPERLRKLMWAESVNMSCGSSLYRAGYIGGGAEIYYE